MNPTTKRILTSTIVTIFLLAACIPAAAPTQSPEDTANQIATSVALTVAAQNTQTAAAIPPATNTTLPTQTESGPASPTPIIPTATPFVVLPPTLTPGSSSGGGVIIKPEFDCTVVNNVPFDDTIFKRRQDFEIKWTIVNTGTKTMRAGLDLKYFSGPKMFNPADSPIQLPELKPNERFVVNLDVIAPAEKGRQVMTWVVEGQLCYPYVAIITE